MLGEALVFIFFTPPHRSLSFLTTAPGHCYVALTMQELRLLLHWLRFGDREWFASHFSAIQHLTRTLLCTTVPILTHAEHSLLVTISSAHGVHRLHDRLMETADRRRMSRAERAAFDAALISEMETVSSVLDADAAYKTKLIALPSHAHSHSLP